MKKLLVLIMALALVLGLAACGEKEEVVETFELALITDVGTIDDFVSEFGYEVHKWDDVRRIERTYKAVVRQYNALCKIFTPEQMEKLREIQ